MPVCPVINHLSFRLVIITYFPLMLEDELVMTMVLGYVLSTGSWC